MPEGKPLKKEKLSAWVAPLYDKDKGNFQDVKEIRKSEIAKTFDRHFQELRLNKPYSPKEIGVAFGIGTSYINELKEVLKTELPKRSIKMIEPEDGSLVFVPEHSTVTPSAEPALEATKTKTQTVVSNRKNKSPMLGIRTSFLNVKRNKENKAELEPEKEILETEKNPKTGIEIDKNLLKLYKWLRRKFASQDIDPYNLRSGILFRSVSIYNTQQLMEAFDKLEQAGYLSKANSTYRIIDSDVQTKS